MIDEMKLSEKQRRFADEYVKSGNIEQSALEAGYSKTYARAQSHKLLANVGIKTYIDERLDKLKSEKVMEQQEILELYTSIARGELESEGLIGMGQGYQEKTKLKPTTNERLKALESLAKINQMFVEKQQIEHSGLVQFVDDI